MFHGLCFGFLLLTASPETPAFEPTENYEAQTLEGWKCLVNKRLLGEKRELGDRTLTLLRVKLYDLVRVVPEPALVPLRKVPIWIEMDDDKHNPCCCYHVSAAWLRQHGFNPEKERAVEICSAQRFIDWTQQQPYMILHELAHGYHHQVFGYDEPRLVAAHKRVTEEGKYQAVLRWSGKRERHYALTNPMEYFAEATEAYFGVNDFYPFVRAELKEHDPAGYSLIEELWKRRPEPSP